MITNLAQFRLFGIGRAQSGQPTIRSHIGDRSNDRIVAASHRDHRPTLVCRWQQVPSTGVLECVWQSVDAGAGAAGRTDTEADRRPRSRAPTVREHGRLNLRKQNLPAAKRFAQAHRRACPTAGGQNRVNSWQNHRPCCHALVSCRRRADDRHGTNGFAAAGPPVRRRFRDRRQRPEWPSHKALIVPRNRDDALHTHRSTYCKL
jgi:hypothetical protein